MKNRSIRGAFALTLVCACMTPVYADSDVVSRVVVVETEDVEAYVGALEKGKALLKKAGSTAKLRVWRARFAGEDAGTVVVTVEHANLQALVEEDDRLADNEEWSDWLASLDDIRTIRSDSLYEEL